jgi:hypothetical protein
MRIIEKGRRIADTLPTVRRVIPCFPMMKPATANTPHKPRIMAFIRMAMPRLKIQMVIAIEMANPKMIKVKKIT